jgi:hypothetical protein
VVDDATRVGSLSGGMRLELDQDGDDWRRCRVFVSTLLAEAQGDQFVQLKPGAVMANIRVAPVLGDATDVGDLLPGQQLELIQLMGDWLLARVFVSAQFSDVVAGAVAANEGNGADTTSGPSNAPMSAAEVHALSLTPAQRRDAPAGASPAAQTAASIWNKYGGMLEPLAIKIGIDPAVAVAVVAVESGGSGFGADGRMIIRFENLVFWSEWGKDNPNAFDAHFTRDPQQFRASPDLPFQPTHTNHQTSEWGAFDVARSLNPSAAKQSISMGLAQIMGFNFGRIGYPTVDAMFDAFSADERWQLLGLFSFIAASRSMVQALQQGDFTTFARGYNGDSPEAPKYGAMIQGMRDAFNSLPVPQAVLPGVGVMKDLVEEARPKKARRAAPKKPAAKKVGAKKSATQKSAAKKTRPTRK